MYKDKDKQKEANRQAKARQRAKQGMTSEGMTQQGMTDNSMVSDQEFTSLLASLPSNSPTYRVSKPGDADYVPMCETTRRFIKHGGNPGEVIFQRPSKYTREYT